MSWAIYGVDVASDEQMQRMMEAASSVGLTTTVAYSNGERWGHSTADDNTAETTPPTEDNVSLMPTQNDTKAAWIAYAVANGETEDDASAMTKAELIEKYGYDE